MSDYDAYKGDMERIAELSDRDIDRLIAGEAPSSARAVDDLAAFIRDIRTQFGEPPTEWSAAAHLAAIVQAAEARTAGDMATPTLVRSGSPVADLEQAGRSRSGSIAVRWRPSGRRRARLVAAVVVLLSGFGGAAYAGALPGPVQGEVADLVGRFGIELPGAGGHDPDQGNTPDLDRGTVHEPAADDPSEPGTQRTGGTQQTGDAEDTQDTGDTEDAEDTQDTGDTHDADDDEAAGDVPGDPDQVHESDASGSREGGN